MFDQGNDHIDFDEEVKKIKGSVEETLTEAKVEEDAKAKGNDLEDVFGSGDDGLDAGDIDLRTTSDVGR